MPLPVVLLDTPNERRHRTEIATALNELVKFVNRLNGTTTTEFARYADAIANFTGTLQYGGIEVGYRGLPVGNGSSTISGNYSLVNADAGKAIVYVGTGGHTLTFPSGVLNANSVVEVWNAGSGALTIFSATSQDWYNGSGTLGTGSRTLSVGGVARLAQFNNTTAQIATTGIGLS